MTIEPVEENTIRLAASAGEDNVMALKFGPEFISELRGLAQTKQAYDIVLVDATESGFLFPAEILIEAAEMAKNVLKVQGSLVFVRSDKAISFVRDSLIGLLSCHIFGSLAELFDYSPSLARHIHSILGNATSLIEESTDLSEQVLMSSIPVLTQFGIKLKVGMESTRRRNYVLGAIDNYTPISAIAQKLIRDGKMSREEMIQELRSLEQSRAVYPIFAKVPFLVHCFRNKVHFELKDYLLESWLITKDQLDQIFFEQNNTRTAERLSLGAMCVAKGFLSSRQLEVALQDQAFYGQMRDDDEEVQPVATAGEESLVKSLVGHLGTTDPAGLLQSLGNNRESGVLSVENQGLQFRALLQQGRVTHSKMGKIKGNSAIVEFVSVWEEGVFVFMQRQPPADLSHDSCKVTKALEKLLLDAALAKDNMMVVWGKLPRGIDTTFEKLPDSKNLFPSGQMVDLQEKTALTSDELETMQRIWQSLDGLSPFSKTIKEMGDIPTGAASRAVDHLLHYQLISIPGKDVTGPLYKFQKIIRGVGENIGLERNLAMLRLSLQATLGYSVRARIFVISANAELGLDMAAAKQAATSLTTILTDLENWQVKYIEYVSQDLDRNVLKDIVYKVHKSTV